MIIKKTDEECIELYRNIIQGNPNMKGYVIKKGLIMFRPSPGSKERVFVPKELRRMILHYFHDGNPGIHLGIKRTWMKIKGNYYWTSMYPDVRKYVQ